MKILTILLWSVVQALSKTGLRIAGIRCIYQLYFPFSKVILNGAFILELVEPWLSWIEWIVTPRKGPEVDRRRNRSLLQLQFRQIKVPIYGANLRSNLRPTFTNFCAEKNQPRTKNSSKTKKLSRVSNSQPPRYQAHALPWYRLS